MAAVDRKQQRAALKSKLTEMLVTECDLTKIDAWANPRACSGLRLTHHGLFALKQLDFEYWELELDLVQINGVTGQFLLALDNNFEGPYHIMDKPGRTWIAQITCFNSLDAVTLTFFQNNIKGFIEQFSNF